MNRSMSLANFTQSKRRGASWRKVITATRRFENVSAAATGASAAQTKRSLQEKAERGDEHSAGRVELFRNLMHAGLLDRRFDVGDAVLLGDLAAKTPENGRRDDLIEQRGTRQPANDDN